MTTRWHLMTRLMMAVMVGGAMVGCLHPEARGNVGAGAAAARPGSIAAVPGSVVAVETGPVMGKTPKAALAAAAAAYVAGVNEAGAPPPIAIPVTLAEPGYVTLVIEDASGQRVRNLISETPLPAGEQVVYWDGLDDLARDPNAASHAIYHIPGRLVAPGSYTVRGLTRQAIDLSYEFTPYNHGNPPWQTKDRASQWLTNHTPPSTVCFVPAGQAPARGGSGAPAPAQVLIGSYVAEGGSGLAWVDLQGKKLNGQMWVGGVWTGAALVTADAGPQHPGGVYAYTASAWKGDKYNNNQAELRLHSLVTLDKKLAAPKDTRMGSGEDPAVLTPTWKFPRPEDAAVGGLAAYDGLVVVSLPKLDQLLLVDAANGKVLGTSPLPAPGGLLFDRQGRLLAVSGLRVVRLAVPPLAQLRTDLTLPAPELVLAAGLEAPQQLALDAPGNLYVSDQGRSHQVKVFAPTGALLRAIGTAGEPVSGPYDPTHMNHPKGIAVTDDGHLWVTEDDFQPKRVSVWTLDGKLVQAFYGPPIYGGGGTLDPHDATLFYHQGMTFKLDWKRGTDTLIAVHARLQEGAKHDGGLPETPLYREGRQYWQNGYTSNPTNAAAVVSLWRAEKGVAIPAASFGSVQHRQDLQTDAMLTRLPAEVATSKTPWKVPMLFVWVDLNGDGVQQPEEVTMRKGETGSGVTLQEDFAFITTNGERFAPQRFTDQGVPVYDLEKSSILVPGAQRPTSSGGGQVLGGADGWAVFTVAPKPFAPQSLGGAYNGTARWSYPDPWPGLHASHIAAMPEFPGEVIGTTRLLGPPLTPRRGDAGPLWAINGNKGNMYVFTLDGLFVATLFQDCRIPAAAWSNLPQAIRGMSLNGVTNNEESFWPSWAMRPDGQVFIVSNWPAIIRVDGLDTVRRLPPRPLTVTSELLAACQTYFQARELARQERAKTAGQLTVALVTTPPAVDATLTGWDKAHWVTIDQRTKQVGDWGKRKQETQAALAADATRLYVAYRTGEPKTIDNAGTSLATLFKTGGALDLMLGTDPAADPKRRAPVAGDLRLLVASVKGKTVAMLYRPVVPGATGDGVPFGSPMRTIRFAEVKDVSADVVLVAGADGEFVYSIPLATLGLQPKPGLALRGDIGVLRGTGIETTQRAYWTNKATGLTSDIPSEAELTPALWGQFDFTAQ